MDSRWEITSHLKNLNLQSQFDQMHTDAPLHRCDFLKCGLQRHASLQNLAGQTVEQGFEFFPDIFNTA